MENTKIEGGKKTRGESYKRALRIVKCYQAWDLGCVVIHRGKLQQCGETRSELA